MAPVYNRIDLAAALRTAGVKGEVCGARRHGDGELREGLLRDSSTRRCQRRARAQAQAWPREETPRELRARNPRFGDVGRGRAGRRRDPGRAGAEVVRRARLPAAGSVDGRAVAWRWGAARQAGAGSRRAAQPRRRANGTALAGPRGSRHDGGRRSRASLPEPAIHRRRSRRGTDAAQKLPDRSRPVRCARRRLPRKRRTSAPPAPGTSTWFAEVLAHSEGGLNVTYFWSKGAKLHAETVIAGRRITTLVSGNTYYAYDAVGQDGVAITPQCEGDRRGMPAGSGPFGREFEKPRDAGGGEGPRRGR